MRISIHALRVEGDIQVVVCVAVDLISIHALRVEGDHPRARTGSRIRHFYPRPPGGGRRCAIITLAYGAEFLSTPSGWRATKKDTTFDIASKFLSTPSGWRATWDAGRLQQGKNHFYPRPPGGGRQQKQTKFSSVFAQKGEEFASLRRGKRKFAGGVLKRTNFGF